MAKYWSYNCRTGGMHDYTEEEFERAKKFYHLHEKVLWADAPQEDDRIVWVNRGETILFYKKEQNNDTNNGQN